MRQWTVDAFASGPFRGNPACVVEPFDAWPDAAWMQALAAENNQAETAFLLKTADPARFGLRWFTPKVEVDLCGHATFASGHVLLREIGVGADRLAFDTRSGELTVTRTVDGYEMDLPASPPKALDAIPGLAEALGAEVLETWAGSFLVAVVKDEATVRGLDPDLSAIETLAAKWEGCLGVVALADPGKPYAVVDRMFGPGVGIAEDPTTGSLHCNLAPLYAEKLGRAAIDFHQAYPGRGGDLSCEAKGDRVLLRGQAVTVLEAILRVRP